MVKDFILTKEGYASLVERLDYFKTVKRKEASERIKQAREYGDLSENAEYDAAKEEQAMIESDIIRMEQQLDGAVIIEDTPKKKAKVALGSTVVLLDIEANEELEYHIVGSTEASILNGKISNESPLAQAILGKSIGDTCKVTIDEETNYDVKIISVK
ncbi:MAG: transcription elongation factor GreA [Clostridia bacterium]